MDLIFVRLAPATVAELQRLADAEHVTRSAMIRHLLTGALAAREEEAPAGRRRGERLSPPHSA